MEKKPKKIMSDMISKPNHSQKISQSAQSHPQPFPKGREQNIRIEKIQEEKKEKIVDQEFIQEEDIYEQYEESEIEQEERSIDELIHHYGDKSKGRFGCVLWIVAFLAIIALVFAIGGMFTHASISITPKTFSGTVDDSIVLSQVRTPSTIQVGTVTKDFQSEITIAATGHSLADTKATGTVTFFNPTTSPKTIPVGTVILSSKQISYTTNKPITIPKEKSASTPGQATVSITAVTAGDAGNDVLDDFTFAKPTTAEKLITIHGASSISGGATGNESTADPATLEQAEQTVTSDLADQNALSARLAQDLPDNAIELPLVIPLADPTITIDGTQSDGVHVTADRTVTILIVDKSDIANALGDDLNVPSGTNTVLNSWNGLTVTSSNVAQNQTIPQTINIRITGTATLQGDVDTDAIKSQVVGLSRSYVRTILNAIPEISSYTMDVTPPWRRLLPSELGQISVSLKQ